ncbi:MAG: hypothetical protein SVY53_09555 [Chloroflexota bacterium]|nr:hypothetical protein [Chloroflexota bacterium]
MRIPLQLTLACDFRIAVNEAKLGVNDVKIGILPGLVPQLVLLR